MKTFVLYVGKWLYTVRILYILGGWGLLKQYIFLLPPLFPSQEECHLVVLHVKAQHSVSEHFVSSVYFFSDGVFSPNGRGKPLWEIKWCSLMMPFCLFRSTWNCIKKTHSVTNSCHCCCSRAIFTNGKIYKLTIYLKVKGSVISTPRGEAFYGLLLLLFHDCTKLFLPKCSIWPINCQKFPRQNEQTSVIV